MIIKLRKTTTAFAATTLLAIVVGTTTMATIGGAEAKFLRASKEGGDQQRLLLDQA